MKDAGEYIGIGLMVLMICYGCAHCQKTEAEIKAMKAPPAISAPERN